jgi:hypothetical protein
MKLICPECRGEIPLVDVNVSTDLALCRRCEKSFSYADLVTEEETAPVDLTRPPRGTWVQRKAAGFKVGASTRSGAAFFLVPFMCIWSGGSLGGIYGSQLWKGEFNLMMSLFGIPFLLGTILFGSFAAMSACGKVEVRVDNERGEVFYGVGRVGLRRRFRWWKDVRISKRFVRGNEGGGSEQVEIFDGEKKVSVLSGVKQERMEFVLAALQQMKREYR